MGVSLYFAPPSNLIPISSPSPIPMQVAGTNYRAKVHVGDEKYVHMVVHQPLPHTKEGPKLVSAEGGKAVGDAL